MRLRTMWLVMMTGMLIALALPASASAAEEWGSTSKWPWSGYWWPMLSTNLNLYDDGEAMQLYDRYVYNTRGVRSNAQAWEAANHATSDAKNTWWGHCHAWAAAAILTREPPANVVRGGVNFHTNATRGLITELYYQPTFTWLSGTRNDSDATDTAAFKDIHPAWMDWLLRYYVRHYKYPFIMDVSADSQVWNFPVFAYSRNSVALAGGGERVTTRVWFSNPTSNTTGTRYFSRVYTYDLRPGTLGQWTGNSVIDHPDFAWVPTGKKAMPHVNEGIVEEIVGYDV